MMKNTTIHDRTNANEHPSAGSNANIYTARVYSGAQYDTAQNGSVGQNGGGISVGQNGVGQSVGVGQNGSANFGQSASQNGSAGQNGVGQSVGQNGGIAQEIEQVSGTESNADMNAGQNGSAGQNGGGNGGVNAGVGQNGDTGYNGSTEYYGSGGAYNEPQYEYVRDTDSGQFIGQNGSTNFGQGVGRSVSANFGQGVGRSVGQSAIWGYKVPDIIEYLAAGRIVQTSPLPNKPHYIFNEATSNYGDITVY